MKLLSKLEFSAPFGYNLINLFSFENRDDLVVVIQPEGIEVIPVVAYGEDGEVELLNDNEVSAFIISRIHISQVISLGRRLEEVYKSFREEKERQDAEEEEEQIRKQEASDRIRYPHRFSDEESSDGFSSNEFYNDDLDMDQQSQEFWDNL